MRRNEKTIAVSSWKIVSSTDWVTIDGIPNEKIIFSISLECAEARRRACSSIGSDIELLRSSSRSAHAGEIWKDFFSFDILCHVTQSVFKTFESIVPHWETMIYFEIISLIIFAVTINYYLRISLFLFNLFWVEFN